MNRALFLLLAGCLFIARVARADEPQPHRLSPDEMAAEVSALKWQTGPITLRDGLATINLQPGWRFLDGPQAEKVLHDLWGNPPSDPPLGMIFPPHTGPLDDNAWGVEVDYDAGGHVNDADAAKINYDDLLRQLQQQVRDSNPQRQSEGYAPMELVGWAAPPHYDAATHKLYWAKQIREIGAPGSSLNYNVRILGRQGVLELTPIADMRQLGAVTADLPTLLGMVDFKQGHTYAEFNPKVDKVAAYGIGGLVLGTTVAVAAKAGLLKFMIPILIAAKKFIIIIFVALAAGLRKIMGAIKGRSSVTRPFEHPDSTAPPSPSGRLDEPPPPNRDPRRPPPQPPGSGFPPTKSF
jgi:uncharacterized membrane-anchored protein